LRLIYLATEDELSEAVAERLVAEANVELEVAVRMRKGGRDYLKGKFAELVNLANSIPVFLLTDLDRLPCPSALIQIWLRTQLLPSKMLFRVAVREVEAWLMADHEGFANLTGVPVLRLPSFPESMPDPKNSLLNLVRRYGNREIKRSILPDRGSAASVGYGYNGILSSFARGGWDPDRASQRSPSLLRARQRLRELR
jgi:hypothetical protein